MMRLLETGKSPLLEKFISKKGRPFSAYLVRQPDGKIGFEFEERKPKAGGKGEKAAGSSSGELRILGKHPADDQVISVYSGRYGPYIKHGATNATLPDKDRLESLTLEEAIAILAEKVGAPAAKKKPAKAPAKASTAAKRKKAA
jgi:topoisomerase IA-like protein